MKQIYTLMLTMALLLTGVAYPQQAVNLTLDQVIDMASRNSIDAFQISNMYRASYWEFRYFMADRLPRLHFRPPLLISIITARKNITSAPTKRSMFRGNT